LICTNQCIFSQNSKDQCRSAENSADQHRSATTQCRLGQICKNQCIFAENSKFQSISAKNQCRLVQIYSNTVQIRADLQKPMNFCTKQQGSVQICIIKCRYPKNSQDQHRSAYYCRYAENNAYLKKMTVSTDLKPMHIFHKTAKIQCRSAQI
jgi:hypothetical protein